MMLLFEVSAVEFCSADQLDRTAKIVNFFSIDENLQRPDASISILSSAKIHSGQVLRPPAGMPCSNFTGMGGIKVLPSPAGALEGAAFDEQAESFSIHSGPASR